MDVILLERVAKLGQMGDVVSVKEGYARNFLLPQKKALRASSGNIAQFEAQKAQLEARNLETKKEAEDMAGRLDGQQFILIRSASDAGSLYGSVTPRDAAEAATAEGFTVDRKQVALTAPIKELGLHDLIVRLHPEVEATIQVNVAKKRPKQNSKSPNCLTILDLQQLKTMIWCQHRNLTRRILISQRLLTKTKSFDSPEIQAPPFLGAAFFVAVYFGGYSVPKFVDRSSTRVLPHPLEFAPSLTMSKGKGDAL